jgi:hypothetical protein
VALTRRWLDPDSPTPQSRAMPDAPCLAEPSAAPRPGQLLARGVCRHLLGLDFTTLEEMTPAPGLRVDVMALGPGGEIWVVECKSSRADFVADRKWEGYLPFCDRFFWAVPEDFPAGLLCDRTGLIVADGYDARILRLGPELGLPSARRRALTRRFARQAALRWHAARDPGLRLL